MNGLALCAGVGGFEQGIGSVFNGYRTVCYVEGEAYAAACLISQMEKGWVDKAPIWSNVKTFDGNPWSGKVDIISGGFPCQPFSKAGSQKGTDDERHLWPDISRIIGEIRPSIVILENVPNVIEYAGSIVFGDLAQMGYNSSWGIIRASDANAPHRRERFFSVSIHTNAYDDGFPISFIKEEDYDRINPKRTMEGGWIEGFCSDVSNSNSSSQSKLSIDVKEGGIIQQFDEWPRRPRAWKTEPQLGRVVNGVENWVDRLRACGNGVVPQQAKLAIEIMIKKLIEIRIKDSKL